MMIIDSSVWIALYDRSDNQHARAVDKSGTSANVVLPEYVVLETSSILLLKAGKDVAEKFLSYALGSSEVTILHSSPEFFHATVQLFRLDSNKKLSFVDTSLLLLSELHEIVTFDRVLARAIQASRKR